MPYVLLLIQQQTAVLKACVHALGCLKLRKEVVPVT
jgi:hypothetical protein